MSQRILQVSGLFGARDEQPGQERRHVDSAVVALVVHVREEHGEV
jgi:hypothetical protein